MITPKQSHRFQALMFTVGAIVAPMVFLIPSGGSTGGIRAAAVLGSILLAYALYHWFKYAKTPVEARFYDIRKVPLPEQIRVSKRGIWMFALVGPALSIWTYHDLSSLEAGTEASVTVWAPIAMLYDLFGFWPAVLCWPVLCSFAVGSAIFRIAKARSMMTEEEAESRGRRVSTSLFSD